MMLMIAITAMNFHDDDHLIVGAVLYHKLLRLSARV